MMYAELVKQLRTAKTVSVVWKGLMADAAAAIESLEAEIAEHKKANREMIKIYGDAVNLIPNRGEWIGVSPFVDSEQCSICGYCIHSEELETPYCPWCGAKMEVQE